MKLLLVGAAFAVSFAFAGPAAAQLPSTQIDAAREAALKFCTEKTRREAGKRSDDQNQRVAVFKNCMVDKGQRP